MILYWRYNCFTCASPVSMSVPLRLHCSLRAGGHPGTLVTTETASAASDQHFPHGGRHVCFSLTLAFWYNYILFLGKTRVFGWIWPVNQTEVVLGWTIVVEKIDDRCGDTSWTEGVSIWHGVPCWGFSRSQCLYLCIWQKGFWEDLHLPRCQDLLMPYHTGEQHQIRLHSLLILSGRWETSIAWPLSTASFPRPPSFTSGFGLYAGVVQWRAAGPVCEPGWWGPGTAPVP